MSWDRSRNFRTAPGRLTLDVRFNVHHAQIRRGSSWNQVSSLEPFGPETENLPLGHHSPNA
ncbi:hypothetical protein AVEN_64159-1, partial [Araneus ventricosus]